MSEGSSRAAFRAEEFAARGLPAEMPQCSVSYNSLKGTLRGLHFQAAPHAEDKLVRCTAGAIFDVIVDLRPGSPTLRRWFGLELTAENRRSLFVPKGFAHGFLTMLRRQRSPLYDLGALRARIRARRALERSCLRHRLADRTAHHLRARRGVSTARRSGAPLTAKAAYW